MEERIIKNYAKLLVDMGVNLDKGQTLIISCGTNSAPFGRMIAEAAYESGAREVVFDWYDELAGKLKYLKADNEIFDEFPDWRVNFYNYYDEKKAAYIRVISDDPELLKDVQPDRISRSSKVANQKNKKHRDQTMSNTLRWCIAAIPCEAWAKKVFPGLESAEAIEKLWRAIASASRIDGADPAAAWHEHKETFAKRVGYLNGRQFKSVRMVNSLGTDLEIQLPEGHLWAGGGDICRSGKLFFPNIPTEEIFTAPDRCGVNGRIVSSMPLIYQGSLIDGIDITFANGKAVSFSATQNEELLRSIIETDEGSAYLGELALVPYSSPISDMNLLFYNTLYDENASCHVALGKGYSSCIADSDTLTEEQLLQRGLNDSIMHVDFMFGTADLSIIGVDVTGNETVIFKDGNYMI